MKKSLKVAAAFRDRHKAQSAKDSFGGVLLLSGATDTSHLPVAALLVTVTDNLVALIAQADIGCYLVCERTMKASPLSALNESSAPGSVHIFMMVANPLLGHAKADLHWRDAHGPLALNVHKAMTHYYQLSIQHRFSGPVWDGIALCCFANEDDLRTRFCDTKEGEKLIAMDVARFADTKNSPRRVIATMQT